MPGENRSPDGHRRWNLISNLEVGLPGPSYLISKLIQAISIYQFFFNGKNSQFQYLISISDFEKSKFRYPILNLWYFNPSFRSISFIDLILSILFSRKKFSLSNSKFLRVHIFEAEGGLVRFWPWKSKFRASMKIFTRLLK